MGGCCGRFLQSRFSHGRSCTSNASIEGKTVIITGCNTGIGKETAVDLAKRGGKIIMACRSEERALPAVAEVKERSNCRSDAVKFMKLDLGSMKSIREFAAKFLEEEDRLDILINNAGVMMCPQMKTEDGFELQIGTNHLGHFLLSILLLDKIKATGTGSRIVNVSSRAHRGGAGFDLNNLMMEDNYSKWTQYSNSKLANILFTLELARRLQDTGVNVYSLHPGVITTELGRYLPTWLVCIVGLFQCFLKTPIEGAQTTIHCAVSEEAANETGLYYSDCRPVEPMIPQAKDVQLAEKLWLLSEKLVKEHA